LTIQIFINRNSDEFVKEMKSIKLVCKAKNILINVEHDRKMRDFKLKKAIWRKNILNLLMKIRHFNKYFNLFNYFY
jgi:hypothetical protein